MHRSRVATILLVAALLIFAQSTWAKKQTFDELCLEIIESLQTFYPVRATEMGIHSHDFLLADYTGKSVKGMIKSLNDFEKELYRYREANLTPHQRLNYDLIKSNVDMALLDLRRIEWHKKSPMLYVNEAVDGIYFLMLSQHAPLSEKRVAILSRMKAVPGLFATAASNIKAPPAIWIEAAQETLESGSRFYQEVAAELMREFPGQADEISRISTQAREAMNDFSVWLSDVPKGDETGFAIGKINFDYMLSNQFYLTFDSDSMLAIGEALLAEAQQAYSDYEQYVDEQHQNGANSVYVPKCVTVDDILDYYSWETEQVRLFSEESDFVSIPEDIADVSVIETPPFLRSMISGIAYQPAGPFDSLQRGYFYVRPLPRDMERDQLEARFRYVSRRGFKGSVVHEAFPGHHLQMQLAGRNSDPIRKWQMNLMMIEGWALYCEQAIYEQGLFGQEDPSQWLGVLGGIRFRAARIVADVKLHTGQFTYQECVDWMIETLGIESESSQAYIRKEVRRYTLSPTTQMSYLMGKLEILKLRQAAEARDGEEFSLRDFHDALLAEGSVPPALMWEVLGLGR
ncbi:MAG: DUF885 domain-containing protein [bacterium]